MTRVESPAPAEQLTPIEAAAWRGLLRVHGALLKSLDAEMERHHGLSLSAYEVLLRLTDAPEGRLRMSGLAERVLLSRSGLTRLVDRLVREGFVERVSCNDDARGAFAVLTPAGAGLVERARPVHLAAVRQRFLDRFTDAELEELAACWERVLQ